MSYLQQMAGQALDAAHGPNIMEILSCIHPRQHLFDALLNV